MYHPGHGPPQPSAGFRPVGSDRAAEAQGRTFCAGADEPCQMCQEMANARIVRSDELLGDQRELFIVHGNQIYRLLRTRNDKLILQK